MQIIKFIAFLFILLPVAAYASQSQSSSESFIVSQQQKPMSRKKLKQELGQVAKDLFSATADFIEQTGSCLIALAPTTPAPLLKKSVCIPAAAQKALGSMQQHVAYMQRVCASLAQAILDDEPHIAKAKKIDLTASLASLHNALASCKKNTIAPLAPAVHKGTFIKEQTAVTAHEVEMRNILVIIKKDPCLKVT